MNQVLRKFEEIKVKVHKVALGGGAIGKLVDDNDDKVVILDRGLPGDELSAKIMKIKPNYLEARVKKAIKPSDLTIAARCQHFGTCGGCVWQNLKYEDQLEFKERLVKETLQHIGGISSDIVKPIIGAQNPWFYRNKMEYSFGNDENGKVVLGLHERKKRYDILQLKECFLQSEAANKIREAVFLWAKNNLLTVYDSHKNNGLLKSLLIREGKNSTEIMVNLVVSDLKIPNLDDLEASLKNLNFELENCRLVGFFITEQKIRKGRRTEIREHLRFGNPMIRESLNVGGETFDFQIQPQSFFQPNTFQAEVLYNLVNDAAKLSSKEVVYDLYCGTGTIGICLASKARKVYGIEINQTALKDAHKNAELNRIENIEFVLADCAKGLPQLKDAADIVIVDPPRVGLSPKVVDFLIKMSAPKIIYVSCNPATLARDLKLLSAGGYTMDSVQPVDMFPQTAHMECVSSLMRKL